jgi:hypothetical protein
MIKEFFSLFYLPNLLKVNKNFWRGLVHTIIAIFVVLLGWILAGLVFIQMTFGTVSPTTLMNSFTNRVLAEYPQDLVINISKEGVASKNIPGPVYIWKLPENIVGYERFTHFLVVDDNSATLENYEKLSAITFLGTDGFVVKKNDGRSEVVSLKDIVSGSDESENFNGISFGKEDLQKGIFQIIPIISTTIAWALAAIFLLSPIFFAAAHVLWTIVPAVILYVIFKILKKEKDFNESYLLALYAGVPAIVVGSLLSFLIPIPFSQTIIMLLLVWAGFYFTKDAK